MRQTWFPIKLVSTSVILRIYLEKVSTGLGFTGLSNTSTGLIITIAVLPGATGAQYSSAASSIDSIGTLGSFQIPTTGNCRFREVNSTTQPGIYELQFDNTFFSSGKGVTVLVGGVTDLKTETLLVPLVAFDPTDGVRLGLSALPNAAAEAAGGLYTRGTGTGQIAQNAVGKITVDTVFYNGNAVATASVGIPNVNVVAWKNAGPNDLISGRVDANAQVIADKVGYALSSAGVQAIWDALTSALTATGSIGKKLAGWILGSDSKVLLSADAQTGVTIPTVTTVTNPVTVSGTVTVAGTVTVGGYATGQDPATYVLVTPANKISTNSSNQVVASSVQGNVTGSVASVVGAVGSVTGSVGSVTGSVGSVTGNIGGNVVGSVASVTVVNGLASGVITAAAIATGAITNTKFASGAIDSSAFAQGAADKVWSTATRALTDKAGFALSSSGVDLILIDGKTLPAAVQIIAAICAGQVSGAGTDTEIFVGLDASTTRVTVTADSAGNRSAVVYG